MEYSDLQDGRFRRTPEKSVSNWMLRFKKMEDNNMNIKSSKNILLTGAGFTKNFGGLLASEMWAEIFNYEKIQSYPKIKELMWDESNSFDYESIYNSIKENSYADDEKEAFNDAVKSAYEYIDTNLIDIIKGHPRPNELFNVEELISWFSETGSYINHIKSYVYPETNIKSFIFTLNQDLFFERLHDNHHEAKLSIPGIKNNSEWFKTTFNRPLNLSDYYQLPNEEELNRIKPDILSNENFFLIKLHGSYNWISFDSTQKMGIVIGRGKIEHIQKEPLLNYYFEIFKDVLFKKSRRLLIIGYGFGDDHINDIIAEAVRVHGLKIFVISPSSPDEFNKLIKEKNVDEVILHGIAGYFQNKLTDIFPENPSIKTQASRNLFNTFFE